ncbi:hypothetical protein CK203_045159 [Vitis vinifera]|uniref:Uncharacterized protein n=1 Tax=Vitis vinifera TaxID=29760 RepID=A0A438HCZ5_VITVI|nr:hypothetical protein CK203_045159 [Vitis vinifera]
MEHLLAPKIFLPRIATDFYQSMTTKEVRNPTLIHLQLMETWYLGAHIAEALQIPFEPTQFDNFRAWANPTELEMVRTLSRGAANRSPAEGGASSREGSRRSFKEQIAFPPLPKAAMPNFGASGIPSEPQLERKRNASSTSYPCHLSHPHQLSRGWPFLYLNIESCAVHWRLLQLLRAILLRRWQPSEHARADVSPQAQQAAILRQLQVHFDLPQAVEPSIYSTRATLSAFRVSSSREAPADPPTERQILLPS